MTRDPSTGHWRGPIFLAFGQGSVGRQAGASTSEVVMIANSPGALGSLINGQLRLGIDATVAVGKGGDVASAVTADSDTHALERGLLAPGLGAAGRGPRFADSRRRAALRAVRCLPES